MNKLPEIAVLLALYLRDATGQGHIFARVVGQDDADNYDSDGRDYIVIGYLIGGSEEIEIFNLFPPVDGVPNWTLNHILLHSGNRHEPPSTDSQDVLSTSRLVLILSKMAKMIVEDRLADLLQGFEADRNDLFNPHFEP